MILFEHNQLNVIIIMLIYNTDSMKWKRDLMS
jgi:hypothetical protein